MKNNPVSITQGCFYVEIYLFVINYRPRIKLL